MGKSSTPLEKHEEVRSLVTSRLEMSTSKDAGAAFKPPLPFCRHLRWEDRDSVLGLPVKELFSLLDAPGCPSWILELAGTHPSARVRARVPFPFSTPRDPSLIVRASVAKGPNLDLKMLETLAKDETPRVRRAVALNGGSPEHILAALAQDPDTGVRVATARASRSAWLVDTLGGDQEPLVRRAVAGNKVASPETLEILGNDPDVSVRLAVAKHPYTPRPTTTALCDDLVPKVSAAARHGLKARESQLLTLTGEELWRALIARYGRPILVETWPTYGWDRLFTVESRSDGYGGSDTHLRSSIPRDLLPSQDHLQQTLVYVFASSFPSLDWRGLVNEACWDRPGDIPYLP